MTHDFHEAEKLADRTAVIIGGLGAQNMRQQTVVSGKGRPGSHRDFLGLRRDKGSYPRNDLTENGEPEYEVKHLPAQIKKWNSRYADAVEYVY